MKITLEAILYTQSPTLFLSAVILLALYFIRRKEHAVRSVLDLIGGIGCIVLGVALYFIGIGAEVFTIKDFWQIRTPGWVGMALVLLLAAVTLFRTVQRFFRRRAEARSADRTQREHQRQLEDVWKDAYASGMADAMATGSGTSEPPEEPVKPEDADPA